MPDGIIPDSEFPLQDEGPGWEWQDDVEHRHYTQLHCNRKEPNMKVSDQYSSSWLKATDLRGQPITVTISDVKMEQVGQDHKMVCYFQGKDKGLVLNKTNATTIATSLGDETMGWGGRQIVLMPTKVNFQGQMVDAIRVSVPVDQQAQAARASYAGPSTADNANAPAPDFDDDVPF